MKSALSAVVAPAAIKAAPRLRHVSPGIAAVLMFGILVAASTFPFLMLHESRYEVIGLLVAGVLWGTTASLVSAELFAAEIQAVLGGAAIQSAVAHFTEDINWLGGQVVSIVTVVIVQPVSHHLDTDIRRIVGSACVAFIVVTMLSLYFQRCQAQTSTSATAGSGGSGALIPTIAAT